MIWAGDHNPATFLTKTTVTRASIHNGVTSIGASAFRQCTTSTQMYFDGNAPSVGGGWIEGHNAALTIYYHEGATGFPTPTWDGVPTATY
jgi:hypothetical protein